MMGIKLAKWLFLLLECGFCREMFSYLEQRVSVVKKDTFRAGQSESKVGSVFAGRLVACCIVFSGLSFSLDVSGDEPNSQGSTSNISAIASGEVMKRQQQVQAAQTLFTSGSKAYSDRSYGEAMDYFKAAYETTPQVPATAEMRRAFFKRYQRAALSFTEILISEAKWAEAEQTLDEVYNTAERGGIAKNTLDPGVRKTLKNLKSKDYYNMANSPRHIKNIAEVKRLLTLARGYKELGVYDRALRSYNKVLAIDPFNTAARRGAEDVERHIMDYADAARNHTRAANLAQVAKGWEMPVPELQVPDFVTNQGTDLPHAGRVMLETKLKSIIIPRLEFNQAELADVLAFLSQKAQELDVTELDPLKKGLNIVIDKRGSGEDPSHRTLSLQIANVPLGDALKYVTQKVGMKYVVDDYAVSVVPLSAVSSNSLVVRTFSVPPGFIQGGDSGPGGDENTDPFAPTPEGGGGTLVVRVKAQEFLERLGIEFGPGAVAEYSNGSLIVKNTPEQILIIERMVQDARDAGSKNVQVNVKMVSIGENELKMAGIDFLLGSAGVGGSSNAFFTGGTNGNSNLPAIAADYPFPIAGMNPVTSGLRTGTFNSTQSIDNILVGAANPNGVAPGVFSVSALTNPQFGMVIRALDQIKGSDLLCDAYVTVNPGQKARIEQVREFIYPTEYDPPEIPNQVGDGSVTIIILPPPLPPIIIPSTTPFIPVTPATPTAFEMRKVGKILEVEPTVSEDNKTVGVSILADFTDFVGFVNYGTPIGGPVNPLTGAPTVLTPNRILMPVFDVVRETTVVEVWDGQTIVIGGFHGELIAETEDKIPGVGDLPFVGRAFRSTTSSRRKRALLIFVTVRLIDPGGNPINAAIDELAAQ